jgi:hypothetical protein
VLNSGLESSGVPDGADREVTGPGRAPGRVTPDREGRSRTWDDLCETASYRPETPASPPSEQGSAPTVAPGAFLERVVAVGLIEEAEVEAFLKRFSRAARPESAELLARELVRVGKLTEYQAGALLQGKARGLSIGDYVVLDKLGRGGMGLVFKARHRRMKRIVALKVLPPSYARNVGAVNRFQREVEAVARLGHPNIVAALDAGEYGGLHYLVMEFVDGRDLACLVAQRGPLPVDQAINCVIQAARGLEAAHAKGIYHRDIKPSNLMLDSGGRVKVLDLGLARFESTADLLGSATADPALTRPGDLMGTVGFMSPEQAYNAQDADHRSDLYSLGCTLYFLLTGTPPFTGATTMACLLAHREHPIPALGDARPEAPRRLDRTLRRMLAKVPEDRYPTADALIAALEASSPPEPEPEPGPEAGAARGPVLSPPIDPGAEDARRTVQPLRSRRPRATIVIAGGLLLVAAVAGMVARGWFRRGGAVVEAVATKVPVGRTSRDERAQSPSASDAAPAPPADTTATAPSPRDEAIEPPGEVRRFERVENLRVEGIAVSADGARALTAGDDWRVRCWDVATGSKTGAPLAHDAPVLAVAFSPDGRYAVSGGRDRSVRVWDPEAGREIRRLDGHERAVFSVAFSPDGLRVLSGGGDRSLRLWDVTTQAEIDRRAHDDSVTTVAFSPDGRHALSGSSDRTVRVWDLGDAGGTAIRKFDARSPVQCVAVSPAGDRALSGGSDGALTLWDLAGGPQPLIRRLGGLGDWVRCVSFLPGGRHAVAGTEGGRLIVWDLETGTEVQPSLRVPARHLGLALLPDGRHALTANDDGFVRYWRLPEFARPAHRNQDAAKVPGPRTP